MSAAWVVSLLVTLVGCLPLLALLRRRALFDVPNHRSSHTIATPRGGGTAVAFGCVVSAAVTGGTAELRIVAAGAAACGVLGFVEDIRGIPVTFRLAAQFIIGFASIGTFIGTDRSFGMIVVGVAVGGLLVVSYVNAFNFMDGINGISAGQSIVVGLALLFGGWHYGSETIERGGAIVAASALAFLPFNAPRARMFLGDVGSYFLGGWLALLVVAGLDDGLPLLTMLAPIAIYGIDTSSTILRRVRRHESPLEPHRDHVYQRLARRFGSHLASTTFVCAVTALASLLGFLASETDGIRAIAWTGVLGAVVLAYASLGWVAAADRNVG